MKTTVETAMDLAIKNGNYPALRGMLITYVEKSEGFTLALRLLERIPNIQMLQIIRDLRSEDDEDIKRLAFNALKWKAAYLKWLEDTPDDLG